MRFVPLVILVPVLIAASAAGIAALRRDEVYLVSPLMRQVHLYLPFALAAVCLIGLVMRSWRSTVASMVASALVAVFAAELFLSLEPPPSVNEIRASLMAEGAARRQQQPDKRSLHEVVRALRESGADAYPTFSPTQFLLDDNRNRRAPMDLDGKAVLPLTSVAHTKSVYCNESGAWLVFDSDRHGFNNPDTVWDLPATRLAILGDSFAQGACVQPAESPAALLRVREPSALTAGVGGTGPLLQLAILKEYLADRRPEQVFWFFYEGNDLHVNLTLEGKSAYLREYLKPDHRHRLADASARTDAFLRATIDANFARGEAERVSKGDRGFDLRRSVALLNLRERLGLLGCPHRNQDFVLLREIAAAGRRAVEGWGGRLTVVYLPMDPRGACDLFGVESRDGNWLYDGAMGAFEAAGVPVIDLREPYFAEPARAAFHYYPGSHYSAEGYRFVIRHLDAWMASQRR